MRCPSIFDWYYSSNHSVNQHRRLWYDMIFSLNFLNIFFQCLLNILVIFYVCIAPLEAPNITIITPICQGCLLVRPTLKVTPEVTVSLSCKHNHGSLLQLNWTCFNDTLSNNKKEFNCSTIGAIITVNEAYLICF